jgi:SpoVK/Ycf46/Vps4 family AAA+-type ATPase
VLSQALESALLADPAAAPVRLHLVRVLLDGGEAERALVHCDVLLQAAPEDLAVLTIAAAACDAAGQPGRAEAHRRMIELLGLTHTPPAPLPTGDAAAESGDSSEAVIFGDEVDMFLRDVMRRHGEDHVTLADVGGLDDVKQRIEASFLGPLRRPDLRLAYGKSLRGGLLLWGPPGCGKTYLARAVAGELGASFIPIGIHDVLDMYVGNSERNIRSIFEAARRASPCVLFFDELDALGYNRSRQTGGTTRNVVAMLLTELDGVASDNESVFVLAATNQPWDVDPALRRPGRFDRTILVLPPDAPARRTILEVHLRDRPTAALNLDKLAAATDGFSGADLRLVCESAVESAMIEAHRSGSLQPVTQAHLEKAASSIRPSVSAWLETARNYTNYSNESGDYDELAAYLKRRVRR